MIADEEETQLYGLDKELAEKLAAKYDPKREAEARQYIEELAETPFPSDSFHESLKDGVILCKAVNKILRDIGERDQIKVVVSKMPFKQMENVGNFLAQMERIGVPAHERFLTVDLYEAKDLNQVVNSIFSLSRHAAKRGFRGPVLGPKLTEKNERTFTDEQLRQAAAMPSKLMSFSSNVSSGLSFSGRREIGGKYMEKPASEEDGKVVPPASVAEPPKSVAAAAPAPQRPVESISQGMGNMSFSSPAPQPAAVREYQAPPPQTYSAPSAAAAPSTSYASRPPTQQPVQAAPVRGEFSTPAYSSPPVQAVPASPPQQHQQMRSRPPTQPQQPQQQQQQPQPQYQQQQQQQQQPQYQQPQYQQQQQQQQRPQYQQPQYQQPQQQQQQPQQQQQQYYPNESRKQPEPVVSSYDAQPTSRSYAPRQNSNPSIPAPAATAPVAAAPAPVQTYSSQSKERPTLSITQFKTYAEYKAAKAALEKEYGPASSSTAAASSVPAAAPARDARSRERPPRSTSSSSRSQSRARGGRVEIVREQQAQVVNRDDEDEVVVFDY
ncbi:hypothetical protein CcCBS67573_g08896 [Chytriomyces confervae]|uniref:Calponin-homology (CH) domain-containing protein n=1 Tax=Chytriomyces confervae TaxID=246404 RepID=A0A507ECG0_9FUNG|nr:hypothetical protein HDU80_009223 [Chytriomyces hyalinus]TPX61773.1 hypothetical protein CcCBS67573_g08896 [Chytriomyces confervae]